MRSLGVDLLISTDFDSRIATLSAKDFFKDILADRLKARHIVCGFNYRFGKGGKGDVDMLGSLCREYGIELSVVPPVTLDGTTISSSEIRHALTSGDLERANLLLGRPYSLCARVIDGQHLGRTLGFPTVNQTFDAHKLLPTYGVYASRVRVDGIPHHGITNIGMRPTVGGALLCAETNIFDFEGDLYGRTLTVELLSFIRPEKKFDSVDSLSAQVHADIAYAKEIFKSK
jgi:riboflavin kinase/FMN adenylyltransferase